MMVDLLRAAQGGDPTVAGPAHQQMEIPGRDVNVARQNLLVGGGLLYMHGAGVVHAQGIRRAEDGRNVLGDHHRRAVLRQPQQQLLDGLGATGGRADRDECVGAGRVIGRRRIRLRRNVMPSMRGISMSSVSTSGASCLIFSRAMIGSDAVPTTSMSGSALMIWLSNWRMTAASSTTRTLILPF